MLNIAGSMLVEYLMTNDWFHKSDSMLIKCKASNRWLLEVGFKLVKYVMPYNWPINVDQMLAIHVIYNFLLHMVGEILALPLVAFTT